MSRKSFFCIDGHTCGNPVRLVAGGVPYLKGENIFEKRLHFMEEYDWIRQGLMFEPRGHDMMSGSMLFPPSSEENDAAILFIETSGCLPMCGHGTIGTVTMALQEGLICPKNDGVVRLEAPAGLVVAEYKKEDGKVKSVKITNVPSYLAASECSVTYPRLGEIVFDVAYGGNFYAIIEPQKNFPGLHKVSAADIIGWSREIRELINQKYEYIHPENPLINGASHILWTGEPIDPASHGRNAVFYGDKAIDRSPCGTGTSARIAQLHAKGLLKTGEPFVNESIIGSKFIAVAEAETNIGPFKGIIPSIEGWARQTGYNQIIIDQDDDLYALGFQVL